LGNVGLWSNKKQIRSLGDGFWELKNENSGLRVPFYFDKMNRNVIILTHYFQKNEQKTKKEELKKMKDIKKEFTEVQNKSGGKK
jgi:phage-related protein